MFSRFTLLFQPSSTINASRKVSQTFGQKFKRRLRNLFVVGVVGFSTVYGYQRYRRNRWFKEMVDSEKTAGTKPRIVVLGSGWGALSLLRHLDTHKYEVICVSPRNYFLMTPLLPSVSVGTVETRTVMESIRSLVGPRVQFIEAFCVNVDLNTKVITCNDKEETVESTAASAQNTASSRVVKDSTRTRPTVDLNYDMLVVAIGSENNTFNTPGVKEHAHFLKEIPDARRIRAAISDAFESAMTPMQSAEERQRLLRFVVVGGGPTGVEFAAELSDLIHEDLQYYYPRLCANAVKITLIQSTDHILSAMDKKISDYTEKHFSRENIEVIVNTRVKEVKQQEVIVQAKDSEQAVSIPCSIAVWATGIKARPLTEKIREKIGSNIQTNRMGLLTDQYLRVKGTAKNSVFALGDCATIQQRKLVDQIQSLFEEADRDHQGSLDLQEFQALVQSQMAEFPQLEIFSKSVEKAFAEADKEKTGHLTLDTLRSVLEKADRKLRALPATAQVAHQQGLYLAHLLNHIDGAQQFNDNERQPDRYRPFLYKHAGSLAYVGGDAAVLDFTESKPLLNLFNLKSLSGHGAAYLWKSYYFTEMFTGRTKALLAFDWLRMQTYGRDISRY